MVRGDVVEQHFTEYEAALRALPADGYHAVHAVSSDRAEIGRNHPEAGALQR